MILWDVEQGVGRSKPSRATRAVTETHAFSPDGRTLYTAGNDGRVIVWDVAGYRRLGRPFPSGIRRPGRGSSPPAFALSPDGRTLAVARLDGRVELIDAETLRRTGGFEAFAGRSALAIEYSPDGRRLAVAGEGGGVGVWDAGSGERVGPLLRAPRGPRTGQPREPSRRSPSARAVCSPRREVGGRGADLGRSAGASCSDRRCACLPPCSGWRSARTARSSRFRSAPGSDERSPTESRSSTSRSGERVARLPPTARSARSPSPPTAACSRVAGRRRRAPLGDRRLGAGGSVRSLAGAGRTHRVEFSPDGHTLATSHSDRLGRALGRRLAAADRALRRSRARRATPATARFTPGRRPPVRALRHGEPVARDPLGGRSRALAATRVRPRRRRPHARAVGGARPRAGLPARPAPRADERDRWRARRPRLDRALYVPNVYRRVGAFWLSTGTEPRLIGRPGGRPRHQGGPK